MTLIVTVLITVFKGFNDSHLEYLQLLIRVHTRLCLANTICKYQLTDFLPQDAEKRTPLHAAAFLGDAEITELLILSGKLYFLVLSHLTSVPSLLDLI